jgi:hypothetical protein
MPQNFLSPQRDQPLLLPVDMREWLPLIHTLIRSEAKPPLASGLEM